MKRRYMESENVIFGYDVVADEQRVQIDIPILNAQLAIRFAQVRPRARRQNERIWRRRAACDGLAASSKTACNKA